MNPVKKWAFPNPVPCENGWAGLTKREYIATRCLASLVSRPGGDTTAAKTEDLIRGAYDLADAMLAEPHPPTITVRELVEMIKTMLLKRQGEPLTQAVAAERANNIATALAGMRVLP